MSIVYVFGGVGAAATRTTVEAYGRQRTTWTTKATMLTSRQPAVAGRI